MEITLSKRAAKALEALDKPLQARITAGIYNLPVGDIKKLRGHTASFRLRVGGYRVLFEMTAGEIRINDILPRGDAYK